MSQTSAILKGKRCMCPTCGEFFSSITMFDKHRAGEHGVDRHCLDPQTLGMVIRERGNNTYWTMPMPDGFVFGARRAH